MGAGCCAGDAEDLVEVLPGVREGRRVDRDAVLVVAVTTVVGAGADTERRLDCGRRLGDATQHFDRLVLAVGQGPNREAARTNDFCCSGRDIVVGESLEDLSDYLRR